MGGMGILPITSKVPSLALGQWLFQCLWSNFKQYGSIIHMDFQKQLKTTAIHCKVKLFCVHIYGIYIILWILLHSWGYSKNAYGLLTLRPFTFSTLHKNNIFQCVGKIYVWNLKGTLWNSTKISYQYSERCVACWKVNIWELLDMWAHKNF